MLFSIMLIKDISLNYFVKTAMFFFVVVFSTTSLVAQKQVWPSSMIDAIDNIDPISKEISFSNSLPIDNTGGHIQGIQLIRYQGTEYQVLSGSSSTYSYYSIVKTGSSNIVLSVNKILDKPLKHSGGFQIWNDLMAIGVEDNEAKNRSSVFIFRLDNPNKPPAKPLTIIERVGSYKRGTAGCVAISVVNGKVLVAVGDWDTEHLDFYRIAEEKLYREGAILELEYTLDSKDFNKEGWTDPSWNSYQSINFVKDSNDGLYLAGMTSVEQDENMIDIFQIQTEELSTFQCKKIYSKKFPANNKTKFRWGAGLDVDSSGNIRLMATEEHIKSNSIISIYE